MPDEVLFHRDGKIAILTLNRPKKLNAIDYATADALLAQLDAIEIDPDLHAVILTRSGAGPRFRLEAAGTAAPRPSLPAGNGHAPAT